MGRKLQFHRPRQLRLSAAVAALYEDGATVCPGYLFQQRWATVAWLQRWPDKHSLVLPEERLLVWWQGRCERWTVPGLWPLRQGLVQRLLDAALPPPWASG